MMGKLFVLSVSLVYRTVQSEGSLRPAAVYRKVLYFQMKQCRIGRYMIGSMFVLSDSLAYRTVQSKVRSGRRRTVK